jgi:cysteine desulfurase
MIYLDANATTAPSPAVIAAMTAVLSEVWANASSQHGLGQQAKRTLAAARNVVARALDCKPAEVVFTSGATEANQLAVCGALARAAAGRQRWLLSAVEHAGLLKLAQSLKERGQPVELLPVRADGSLDLAAAAARMGADVALVSLMAANNETGVLMPVAEVVAMARSVGASVHVDATQLIGKKPFSFAASAIDLLTLSAHKLHGPKGVGALLVRQGVALAPQFPGSQERGRRGGTENLPAIAGMACALEQLEPLLEQTTRLARLRDRLEAGLCHALPTTHIWGRELPRLPGTSYLRFGHLPAELVLQRLETLGVAAAAGAACAASGSAPSHVLTAMGVPQQQALAAVRLSLDRSVQAVDIEQLLVALPPLLGAAMHEYAEAA